NFHRSLVGLDGDQALFGLDRVAGFDQQLDHRHFVEVADVGDLDIDDCHLRAPYSNTRRKSLRIWPRYTLKRAAAAPSITRWSQVSDSGSIRRGWKALPSHTGSMVLLHTPRMATSGALMMGVK